MSNCFNVDIKIVVTWSASPFGLNHDHRAIFGSQSVAIQLSRHAAWTMFLRVGSLEGRDEWRRSKAESVVEDTDAATDDDVNRLRDLRTSDGCGVFLYSHSKMESVTENAGEDCCCCCCRLRVRCIDCTE